MWLARRLLPRLVPSESGWMGTEGCKHEWQQEMKVHGKANVHSEPSMKESSKHICPVEAQRGLGKHKGLHQGFSTSALLAFGDR